MSRQIAVVGSLNQDVTLTVPRHPAPGETVLGTGHFTGPGGKGANQAVAAARLGADVALVGRVGDDDAGRSLRATLANEGVDTEFVSVDSDAGTGLAVITLDAAAENAIVVSPGANARLTVSDVDEAAPVLGAAGVCLIQLEVPLDAVEAAVAASPGMVVLNPAPARELPGALLAAVDVLVPNRSELALLTGSREARSVEEATRQATRLGGRVVVVTLGSHGALLVADGDVTHVEAPEVDAVDTTAAGDAFCGALATALADGQSLHDAVRFSVHAGALAATRRGAIASLPSAAAVRSLMTETR